MDSEKPAQPTEGAAPELRAKPPQSAVPPQAKPPPAGLPKSLRTIFLVTAGITVAVWLVAGILFLLDWML